MERINWRNVGNVATLFIAVGVLFFGVLKGVEYFYPEPVPPAEVRITPAQLEAIQQPLKAFFQQQYDRNAATRKAELDAAFKRQYEADSTHDAFTKNQKQRDEKYNSAATAAPADLLREWAERYDR